MQRKFCVAFAFATKKTAGTVQPAARRTHEQTMYLRAAGPAAPTVPIYTLLFLPGIAYFIQLGLEQRIILADPFHLGQIRFYGQFVEFGEDCLGYIYSGFHSSLYHHPLLSPKNNHLFFSALFSLCLTCRNVINECTALYIFPV